MKVSFEYAGIYDEVLSEMSRKKLEPNQSKEAEEITKRFKMYWQIKEKKIISSIEKNSKLKFKRKEIKCYFVNHLAYHAISNQLTIRISGTMEDMRDILIHELIHNIFIDNEKQVIPLIKRTYEDEDFSFKIHVPVLLIERAVTEQIFGQKYFKTFEQKDRMMNFKFEWPEVDKIYTRYKGDIIRFLKNENLD